MLTTAKVRLMGAKKFKGDVDGSSYDSCTVFILLELDSSTGDRVGLCTEPFKFGTSANFEQLRQLSFPCEADVDFAEVSTGGSGARRVIAALRPIKPVARAA